MLPEKRQASPGTSELRIRLVIQVAWHLGKGSEYVFPSVNRLIFAILTVVRVLTSFAIDCLLRLAFALGRDVLYAVYTALH